MKTNTLRAKLLNCFFAFTLVFGLCIPSIGSYAYADPTAETPANDVAVHVAGTTSQGENQSNGNGTGNSTGDTGGTNILGDGGQGNTNANNNGETGNSDTTKTETGTETDEATMQAEEAVPMAADAKVGDLTISGGTQNTDFTISGTTVVVKTPTPLTLSGTASNLSVQIAAGCAANITLANASITSTTNSSPINLMANGSSLKLTIADGTSNTLQCTTYGAGLHVPSGSTLWIDDARANWSNGNHVDVLNGVVDTTATLDDGTVVNQGDPINVLASLSPGSLVVKGGPNASAIGSGPLEMAGRMVFDGGNITAYCWGGHTANGGNSSSIGVLNALGVDDARGGGTGIGAGRAGGATEMEFNAANIIATGSYHGAGIGAGWSNSSSAPAPAKQTGASSAAVSLVCGNIYINGGYLISQGYAHGNAFGGACGTSADNCTIRITGGTLLPYSANSTSSQGNKYDIGGSGGRVIVSGGSVRLSGTQANEFQSSDNKAYSDNTFKTEVAPITIDLSDDLGASDYRISYWELQVGGKTIDYGAPTQLDKGKLYLWLSRDDATKDIKVILHYKDADGKDIEVEPLETQNGSSTAKRWIPFEMKPEYFPEGLEKDYDGLPLAKWSLAQNPASVETSTGVTKLDNDNYVTILYQPIDDEGNALGELSNTGTMPTDTGRTRFLMQSTQFASQPGMTSYWGHSTEGVCTIKPVNAVLTMESAPEWGYLADNGTWTKITEENANAGVAGNRLKLQFNIRSANTTATTCAAPTGSFQVSIDGQKVGEPIPLTAEAMAASNRSSISWPDVPVVSPIGVDETRHATKVIYYFDPTNNDALLKALEDASKGGEHTINIEYIADKNYVQGVDKNPDNAKDDDTFIVPVPPEGNVTPTDPTIKVDPTPDSGEDDPDNKTTVIERTITVPYSKFHQASQPDLPDYFNLEITSSSSASFTYDSTNPAVAGFVKDSDGNVTLTEGEVGIQVNSCGTSVLTLEQKPNALYTGTKYILTVKVVPDATIVPFVQIRTVTNNLTHPGMPAAPGDEIEYLVTGLNTTPGSSWQAAHLLDTMDSRLTLKEGSVKLASNYSTPNMTENETPDYTLGTEAFYNGFDWSSLTYTDLTKDQYDFDKNANKITKGVGSVYGGQSTTLRFVATLQSGTAGRPENPGDPKDIQNEPNGDGGYGKEDADLVLGEDPTGTTPLPKENIVVVGEPSAPDEPVDPDGPGDNPGDNPGGDEPNPVPPLPVIPKDPILPGTDPVDPDNPNPPVNPDDPDNPDEVDPDIYVNKTAKNLTHPEGNKALTGDVVEYTITTGNKGKDTCYYWPIIKDELPVGLEPVAGSFKLTHVDKSEEAIADSVYNKQTRTVALYVDDLYYNEEVTLAFQCTVTPEATDIKNTAQVYGTTPSDKWKGEHPTPDPTPEPGKDETLSYIKFDANGGKNAPEGIEGAPSSEITDTFPTATPTRKGYTFIGWNTAKDGKGTKITAYPSAFDKDPGTIYYYAQWKESYPDTPDPADGDPDPADPTNQAHIAFAANGGTGAPEGISGDTGSAITDAFPTEIPVAPGYKFVGWFTERTGGTEVSGYPANFADNPSTTIYYAQWEKVAATEPDYDPDAPDTPKLTDGDPDPIEKEKQSYVRFSANGGFFNKNIMTQAAGDETTNPNWSTDGLEGAPASEITADMRETFPKKKYNPVYRDGYEFLGWFTKPVGGDLVEDYEKTLPGTEAATKYYYAHWQKDPNYVAPDDDPAPKPGDPVNPNDEGKYPWEEPGTPEIDTPEPVDVGKVMPADPGKDDLRITLSAKNETRMDGYTYVGDEVTYTILIENLSSPEKSWLDVIARADIPEGLKFIPGSVYLTAANGEVIHVDDSVYNDLTRILALNAGDLAGGQTAKVVFKAEVTVEALNKDIGMTSYAYATLPSKFDVNDESYVKPELGSAFVPTEGWEAFAETHVNVFNPEKVYPSEKVSEKTPPLGTPEQQAEAAKLAKTGDTTALVALGIGTLAIAAGVALVVARRRMKKNGR